MNLQELLTQAGRNKGRKRVGRGTGSGIGKTAGRGHKGAGSRAGSKSMFGFEGGQTPMISRIPKRGFSNARFRKNYQIVNVADLERFADGDRVDAESLAKARLISDAAKPVKVLARGEVQRKLTVVVNKWSAAAAEKIAQAGGSIEEA